MRPSPLLRDILPGPAPRPPMTIAMLARELNVPPSRLTPLIEQGYLRRIDAQTVEAPPPEGLLWLRQWFQPVMGKPLFSQSDLADLLAVPEHEIPRLAAAHDIPAIHDPAMGLVFSVWAAKRLLLNVLSPGVRFDRLAMLHFLTGGTTATCPPFEQQVEAEIARVAKLPEPTRSIRRESLLRQWQDAKTVSGVGNERVERAFARL